MIVAEIGRDPKGKIIEFSVRNHGESYVCSAVSMLVLNTVNSIEKLTEQDFFCEFNENGGRVEFTLTSPQTREAGILLDAMLLGLRSVQEQYPDEINLKEM